MTVQYRYGPDESHLGLLEMTKATREVTVHERPPGVETDIDLVNARFTLHRLLHIEQPLPERTSYSA